MKDSHSTVGRSDQLPTSTAGLPDVVPSKVIDLGDGDAVDLRIAPVAKRIGDTTVRMLSYNGSIPGPTLPVRKGSALFVSVANDGDLEATVHWHGLRLENRYDGTDETQAPIPIGGRFSYRIEFPDPGVYWYRPHSREDYGQEIGLYGNILVVPADTDYWPPAHREIPLTLDDVLIEEGKDRPVQPRGNDLCRHWPVRQADADKRLDGSLAPHPTRRGRAVLPDRRRVFKVALSRARMKLVGGDSGRYEVIASWTAKCPTCGMKLMPVEAGVEPPAGPLVGQARCASVA